VKIRKKFDDFEDFLVLVLVDHFSDLPIYFMGSETSPSLRCKLLTEVNIPSAMV